MPTKVDASVVGEHEKITLYGHGGSGKTYLAGTMPGPVYCIVFGGKNEIKTYMSPDFTGKYPNQEISFDFVQEELGERGHFRTATAFDRAGDLLDEALAMEAAGDFEFNSIVIDSISGMRQYAMNKAMEVNYARAEGKGKTALKRFRDENIIIPGDNDWGSQMSLTFQFMDWVFNLPKHVCVIAHIWEEKSFDRASRQTTITYQRPLFTGKNREAIVNLFDNVWYVEPMIKGRGIVGQVHTVPTTERYVKTRMGGVLAPVMRDPNLADVIKKMQEAVK